MTKDLTQEVEASVLTLMEGLDTARSLTVAILVRHREWIQIANLDLDPAHFTDGDAYWRDNVATELLRKLADFADEASLASVTFEKWQWAEHQCKRTNLRLSVLELPRPCLTDGELACADFLSRVRKAVTEVIGLSPPQFLPGRFGPGATVSDPSVLASIPDKMSSVPTYTPNAWLELVPWSGTAWASAQAGLGRKPMRTRGNQYFTVPKSAKTLRACAKEPSINGFYQLGTGSFLKDCLRRVGIDLYRGQQVHQAMAREASLTGDFATIDLSSASDTMASSLVKRVLPPSWFRHLSSLRSPFTFVNGRWIRLEKFSSMGNGFTFELETLVFYGTIKALAPDLVAGRDFWVYGDDIIVPTSIANDVIAALKYIGFTPNPNKTFVKGPFRESCGGDFYGGVGVRAAYLQEVPHEPQQFIAFANALRRTCEVNGEVIPHRWSRVRRAWFRVLDALPRAIKACRGPKDLGDLVVHDDEQRWITRWRSSIRYVRVYRPVATHVVRWEGFAYDVQFAAALYGVPTNLPTKVGGHYPREILVSSRSSVMGYKVGWVPHS